MSVDKEVLLSPEGLKKLEEELETLKTVRRGEVAERIRQARELGDISENSEYEDAKNEQAFIEGRILTLDRMIRNAVLIEMPKGRPHEVTVGASVTVEDKEGQTLTYTIVGSAEADPDNNRISNESPVGRALIGHKPGDEISVSAPGGTFKLKVVAVKKG
jgi:transcription elongation factor GreA